MNIIKYKILYGGAEERISKQDKQNMIHVMATKMPVAAHASYGLNPSLNYRLASMLTQPIEQDMVDEPVDPESAKKKIFQLSHMLV